MNRRRAAARRVEDDLGNAGVLPQGNQAPPPDNQALQGEKALINPQPITDLEIRSAFLTFT